MLIVLSRAAVTHFHASQTTDGWLIGRNIYDDVISPTLSIPFLLAQ
jgi:hypothetical protein